MQLWLISTQGTCRPYLSIHSHPTSDTVHQKPPRVCPFISRNDLSAAWDITQQETTRPFSSTPGHPTKEASAWFPIGNTQTAPQWYQLLYQHGSDWYPHGRSPGNFEGASALRHTRSQPSILQPASQNCQWYTVYSGDIPTEGHMS